MSPEIATATPASALGHLVVPVDAAATSFCYYENDRFARGGSSPIPVGTLAAALSWARERDLAISFVYGKAPLPGEQARLVESIDHVKIVPAAARGFDPAAMVVLNPEDLGTLPSSDARDDLNVIARFPRERLGDVAAIVGALMDRCRRINVILLDIGRYGDSDFPVYEGQLRALVPLVADRLRSGKPIEISGLTDRISLGSMRNCEAGTVHLTLGDDGGLFLCPAFAHEGPERAVGSLRAGFAIPKPELLRLDHAPICALCDAFQCKRCLWLNKRLTGEINTPSRQQCVLSHLEREASRRLVETLRGFEGLRHVRRIREIDYLDPFERIERAGRYPDPE